MHDNYEIVKNLEKLRQGYSTKFLDPWLQEELKKRLKKDEYEIYYPYIDSDKVIFYKKVEPRISLLEIISKNKISHRDILGAIFSLGLNSSMFGDIVIVNNKYYVFVLEEIKDYFLLNLKKIGKSNVLLEERDLNLLKNYQREYEKIEIISSSERIDTVIAHLIGVNRKKIQSLISNKMILYNYDVLKNPAKKFQPNDVFSIRKYGKYKYINIIKRTKSGNLVISINKYI